SFDVRAGEIVGIAGVEGNGQTELIEVLAGLRRASGGGVTLEGREISKLSARAVRELGVAHIPEDRHARGLLLEFNLAGNAILGAPKRTPAAAVFGLIEAGGVAEKASRLIRDFDVRPPNPLALARALSGGNQQKLIVGREFDMKPKLLLVAQPTRGVDIGAIEFIHRKLVELRDAGAAVLLVSAELEEVLSLADRALVMYHGRIVGEVDPQRVSQEEIGLMMPGGISRQPHWNDCVCQSLYPQDQRLARLLVSSRRRKPLRVNHGIGRVCELKILHLQTRIGLKVFPQVFQPGPQISDAEDQRVFALLVLGLDLRRGLLIFHLLIGDFQAVDDLAVDVEKVRDVFDLCGYLRGLGAHIRRGSWGRLRAWRRPFLLR